MKTITVEELSKALQSEIEADEKDYKIYEKVLEVLKAFEGKKISKRIETAFKKKFTEHFCYYSFEHGVYYLNVSRETSYEYNNKLRFLLGYEKMSYSDKDESIISVDGTETHRGFKYLSCCYGEANLARINSKKKLVNDLEYLQKVCNITNNFVTSCKELHDISNGSLGYLAQNLADIKQIPY